VANDKITGVGRKRPQFNISVGRLRLDKDNPRLPMEVQGQDEKALLKALYKEFNLDELAESMAHNGYFDEEPVVAIPVRLPAGLKKANVGSSAFRKYIEGKTCVLTVVEGNRRLAAAKLLLNEDLRTELGIKAWPELKPEAAEDIGTIPVIVYKFRKEVVPYLGVRHIVGIQKWDSYAKARYVALMVSSGISLEDVEAQIGDTRGSARRNLIGYKLLEQVHEEFDFDTAKARDDFSLVLLSVGQGKIKRFLGLPVKVAETNMTRPVDNEHLDNLRDLMSWLYGDGKRGPVIEESRDITRYLSTVVESNEAVEHLRKTWNLKEAYDRTDGEERMVIRYVANANSKLETALGVAHRHRTDPVVLEVRKCNDTVKRLLKTVSERDTDSSS
jgi:hypothetical protein